ncbi:MAG: apolipoprotein N-acyltransferase [Alphaproteobacteria bacterium]|nr:apolipoprotein N-acyltransferase [Alphaproteobacteria bacterium]
MVTEGRWPWRHLAIALVAGAAASLSLPPFGLVPLIMALAVPAVMLARADSMIGAGLIAAAAGFGWFLASLWWISLSMVTGATGHWPLIPLPLFGIPALLALFWLPAGLLAHRFGRAPLARLLLFVAMLSLCEWARGHVATGFPWNAPGYLFSAHLSLLQIAAFLGLYGLTLLALLWAMAPALWWLGWRRLAAVTFLIVPLAALAGMARLADLPPEAEDALPKKVRIVQPAVPQHEKWDRTLRPGHLQRLTSLSRDAHPIPQLVIWPETAFAGLLDREAALLRETSWQVLPFDGWLITGVPRFDSQDRLFNAAALITPQGRIEALYDKRRLVPFGEYVPFRRFLPFADALAGPTDFSPADSNRLFTLPHYGHLQLLICYETLFPGDVVSAGPRPDMLVNLTNDAWFGRTPGPWQHLAQARMRAVEEGIPMIRVANTGISAGFDGAGRKLGEIGLGETGFLDVEVPPSLSPTVYVRWREAGFLMLLVMLAGIVICLDRGRPMRQ